MQLVTMWTYVCVQETPQLTVKRFNFITKHFIILQTFLYALFLNFYQKKRKK